MKKVRVLLGSTLVVLPMLWMSASPSYAYVNDGHDHEFQGAVTYRVANGASVRIFTPNTAPLMNSGDQYAYSEFWDMVNSSDTNSWAQTGAFQGDYGNRYYFFQVDNNDGKGWFTKYSSGDSTTGATGPALGSYHTYDVWQSSGYWWGSVDGAFSSNMFYPNTTNWTVGEVEYEEEIVDDANARFWGTASSQCYMDNLQFTSTDINSMQSTPGNSLAETNNNSAGLGIISYSGFVSGGSPSMSMYDSRATQ